MISVGIDISKEKSTVCFLKPGGEVVKTPYDVMHNNIINKFDTYIKKSLKNEMLDYVRSDKLKQKKYVNFSQLTNREQNELFVFDEYPSELFEEKISTQLFDAIIHNELLYEALLSIKPRSRELIILKFWGDMTDVEIGQVLNMNKGAVNKQKLRILQKLKTLMEEKNNENET